MLCHPYRGSLPLLLKALTPSCLSTSPKLWTIVTCLPALVTTLPRLAPIDDQWSCPAGVADGLWHPTGLRTESTHLVTDRLSLPSPSTPPDWKRQGCGHFILPPQLNSLSRPLNPCYCFLSLSDHMDATCCIFFPTFIVRCNFYWLSLQETLKVYHPVSFCLHFMAAFKKLMSVISSVWCN